MLYASTVIAALFVMIFVTRGFAFIFSRILKNSATLKTIGNYLPAYIMMALVVFEVGIKSFIHYPYAIPAIAACWFY